MDVADKPVRAVIAPHAGYSYSGETAGYAYCAMSSKKIKRVFILGPSHHAYTTSCHVSAASSYRSPLGEVPIDEKVRDSLLATKVFSLMSRSVDEEEHSIEMHVPFVAAIMKDAEYAIVPIMVGSLDRESERMYGNILARYLDDPENFFVISSDFCHWGQRFQFQWRDECLGSIHQSIEWLDRKGMQCIERCSCKDFAGYLSTYRNTICGRNPIAVLLNMVNASKKKYDITFTKYAQSNKVTKTSDSSVSYASALVYEA